MSYIDTTFERGGQVVKTLAKVYGGWDSTKKGGCQFYDQQLIDFRGDIRLSVKVWMGCMQVLDLESLDQVYDDSPQFPLDLIAQFNDGQLAASIANGRVSIVVTLSANLLWIFTSNKKWAVDWGAQNNSPASWPSLPVASHDRIQFTRAEDRRFLGTRFIAFLAWRVG
jgi:hypothetical protein